MYLGNIPAAQSVDFKFNSHKADGTPIAMAGSPVVKVYKDNDTSTEVTTGVTLSESFDGVTGLNHVRVATSDAFYAAGHDYTVLLTAGTVDSVSVVGTVLAHFSIAYRAAPVAKSPATLDWSADVSNPPTIGTSTLTLGDISSDGAKLVQPANSDITSIKTVTDKLDTMVEAV